MTGTSVLLILPDRDLARQLENTVLRSASYEVAWIDSLHAAESLVPELKPGVLITADQLLDGDFRQLAGIVKRQDPMLPMILFPVNADAALPLEALRLGFVDCLMPPLRAEEFLAAMERAVERRRMWSSRIDAETAKSTSGLRERVDALEALAQIGHSVTAHLDIDTVLTGIVDAAVDLTAAEEGTLMLLDEDSGELYMRAARNFHDEFVRTFRLPVKDTLAGEVIRAGQPVFVDEGTPQKIKTAYLVHTLIYVPLKVKDRVIGVLGVDNRTDGRTFESHHLTLMSAFAEFAAIAIENAQLFSGTEIERQKLETILTQIEDGVIVFDPDDRLLIANRAARSIFGLGGNSVGGLPVAELAPHRELFSMVSQSLNQSGTQFEYELDDGRTFSTQVTVIPNVGRAISLQEITHFKELDQLKNDFVNTVSHDLRSPLTAILGYAGLIERSGPLNEQQEEYVRRVQTSVQTITELINKLLDLGRIEAGFDKNLEMVAIPGLIERSVEGLRHHCTQKDLRVRLELPEAIPRVRGNETRLRQMFDNLIGNAIKYTPPAGKIVVRIVHEEDQILIQIEDNGIGIPAADQPYIFDKLYRASNVPKRAAGTGLGLSIVRSIVDGHRGRIWADSTPGQGSTFTIVFPVVADLEAHAVAQETATQRPVA